MKKEVKAKTGGGSYTPFSFTAGNSGVKQAALKSQGRNVARANNQKGGKK